MPDTITAPTQTTTQTPTLILGGIQGPGVDEARALITTMAGSLVATAKGADLTAPETAAQQRDNTPGAHLVLLYPDPQAALAKAMAEGQTPSASLQAWQQSMEPLLAVCRANRRHTTLICAQGLLADPAPLNTALAERLGQPLYPAPANTPAAPENPTEFSVLATYTLAEAPGIQPLLTDLEVSSLGYVQPQGDLAAADSAFETLTAPQVSTEYKEENDLLIQQLHTVQEELEQHLIEKKELATKVDTLESKAKRTKELEQKVLELKSDLEKAETKQKETQEENDLVLQQLFKVQEELEKYYLENRELKEKIDKQRAEIDRKNEKLHNFSQDRKQLNQKLQQLRSSRSWKITAPLRAVTEKTGAARKTGEQS